MHVSTQAEDAAARASARSSLPSADSDEDANSKDDEKQNAAELAPRCYFEGGFNLESTLCVLAVSFLE